MKKTIIPNVKIIDDFFEIPDMWRDFAMGQDYQEISKGIRVSKSINELSVRSFHTLAKKLSMHSQHRNFPYLDARFYVADTSCIDNEIYQENNGSDNIGAVIFLNQNPPVNTGISFYNFLSDKNKFQKTVTIENHYNRCVLYKTDSWISHNGSFGNDTESGRLVIKISGVAK